MSALNRISRHPTMRSEFVILVALLCSNPFIISALRLINRTKLLAWSHRTAQPTIKRVRQQKSGMSSRSTSTVISSLREDYTLHIMVWELSTHMVSVTDGSTVWTSYSNIRSSTRSAGQVLVPGSVGQCDRG